MRYGIALLRSLFVLHLSSETFLECRRFISFEDGGTKKSLNWSVFFNEVPTQIFPALS